MTAPNATLLNAVRTIALEIGIPAPTTCVNPNQQVAQIIAQCNRAGMLLRDDFDWPVLRVQFIGTPDIGNTFMEITMGGLTCNHIVPDTAWDSMNFWQFVGPVTDQEWAQWQYGVMTQPIRKIWRASDVGEIEFFPAIDSSNASTFNLTFMRNEWVLTAAHGATDVMAGDGDSHYLNPRLLISYAKRNFLEAKGLPYDSADAEFNRLLDLVKAHTGSSRTISLARRRIRHFVNYANTPDTGYGP